MEAVKTILEILDTKMETPKMYGWFHLAFLALTVIATVIICRTKKAPGERFIRKLLISVSCAVILLEIYKQINYSFSYDDAITFDYQWYAFPFQFCSTPMYIGLLAGLIKKEKLHDCLCAYLATFSLFAGICVMLYPAQVFISTAGINIQTMINHGSMIFIGIYLLYSGYVRAEHKTVLKAVPVFASLVTAAALMNELAFRSGLLERETFNMFFISPYCDPSLPVYSAVQKVVPFPFCLIIYITAFSLAAYMTVLIAILIKKAAQAHMIPKQKT